MLTLLAACGDPRSGEPPAPLEVTHEAPAPLPADPEPGFFRIGATPDGDVVFLARHRFWRREPDGALSEVAAQGDAEPWLVLPDGQVVARRARGEPIERARPDLRGRVTTIHPAALERWTGSDWQTTWPSLWGEWPCASWNLTDGGLAVLRDDGFFRLSERASDRLSAPDIVSCDTVDRAADGTWWAATRDGRLVQSEDLRTWNERAAGLDPLPERLVISGPDLWLVRQSRATRRLLSEPGAPMDDRGSTLLGGRFFSGRQDSLLVVSSRGLERRSADDRWTLEATIGSLGSSDENQVKDVRDVGEDTWVAGDAGVYRVRGGDVARLWPNGHIEPWGRDNRPQRALVAQEVVATSPHGQVVRLQGDELVQLAALGRTGALLAWQDSLWVGGEGRLVRLEPTGKRRETDVAERTHGRYQQWSRPMVKALAPGRDGTLLLGTASGLRRLNLDSAGVTALPLDPPLDYGVTALQRVDDTLFLGEPHGFRVLDLDDAPPLPGRAWFHPYHTSDLAVDAEDGVLIASDFSAVRRSRWGVPRLVLARTLFCMGQCNRAQAIAAGDGLAWLGIGSWVRAVPLHRGAAVPCEKWVPPADTPGTTVITDLAVADHGVVWAVNDAGLHRLDTVRCEGRTWRWPSAAGAGRTP